MFYQFKSIIWFIIPGPPAIAAFFIANLYFHSSSGEAFIAAITVALGFQYFKESIIAYS
jgi:hypothetical protein